MTTGNTSRVFAAALAAHDRLKQQSWPNHYTMGEPQLAFADDDPQSHAEIISILTDVGDDAAITWRSLPGGRDERFDIVFSILSATGEDDQRVVVERLEQLADVVQRAFYDDIERTMTPLDVAEAVKLEGVGQVSFIVTSMDAIEGYVGRAFVTYRLHFRI